jgi:hypothetical protein
MVVAAFHLYNTALHAGAGASDCALVIEELDRRNRLPGYAKGAPDIFRLISGRLGNALKNAERTRNLPSKSGTDNPLTKVHRLVCHLMGLKRRSF